MIKAQNCLEHRLSYVSSALKFWRADRIFIPSQQVCPSSFFPHKLTSPFSAQSQPMQFYIMQTSILYASLSEAAPDKLVCVLDKRAKHALWGVFTWLFVFLF